MAEPTSSARTEIARMTRRRLLVGAAAGLAGFGAFRWLKTRSLDDGVPWPLRRAHQFNERVGRGLFSDGQLAPEFPIERAGEPRVNGWIGYSDEQPVEAGWVVTVHRPDQPKIVVPLAKIAALPRVDSVIEFKCVEGWSQISAWSGFRLRDFFTAFQLLDGPAYRFVQLATHDGTYQSALDMPSALHPQTILADRLNGQPLTRGHGAPLRLVVPVKYGIKNIKWLSTIRLSNDRPTDYWTERGYDWYAGL